MTSEKYLSEQEIDKLKTFNQDTVLKNAIRKVLLEPIYGQGVLEQGDSSPARNFALTQSFNMLMQKREMWDLEKIGFDVMTSAKAIQYIEQGFGEVEKYQIEETKEEAVEENPAE
jgi:hypothetical protein